MRLAVLINIYMILSICFPSPVCAGGVIKNDTDWKDTNNNPISCHDGGITRINDIFYWYGTSYKGNPQGLWGRRGAKLQNGFNVYSSKNLVDWKYEGVCLEFPKTGWLSTGTSHRANVLFNEKTQKYVMWFFCIGNRDPEYPDVMLAVAIADSPTGPFKFIGKRKTGEKHGWGQDLGLFEDDDSKAYLVYDDGHRNIRVDLLSDDYLSSTKKSVIALKPSCEGSAMIKYKDKYIVAGSGVRGWNPTETVYAVATSPLGPYSEKKVMSEKNTWGSQISNFLHIKESDTLMAICDQWWGDQNGRVDIDRSRYLWLPVSFDPASNTAKMVYKREWSPFSHFVQ